MQIFADGNATWARSGLIDSIQSAAAALHTFHSRAKQTHVKQSLFKKRTLHIWSAAAKFRIPNNDNEIRIPLKLELKTVNLKTSRSNEAELVPTQLSSGVEALMELIKQWLRRDERQEPVNVYNKNEEASKG